MALRVQMAYQRGPYSFPIYVNVAETPACDRSSAIVRTLTGHFLPEKRGILQWQYKFTPNGGLGENWARSVLKNR